MHGQRDKKINKGECSSLYPPVVRPITILLPEWSRGGQKAVGPPDTVHISKFPGGTDQAMRFRVDLCLPMENTQYIMKTSCL